ncbi:hypothetical protein LNP74_26660 [Klebsiella pneumoniae subsp. pneumoniae]|nr:hypothetical protein [Klebsiella pneumoniae subsp. pneumoniae]
MTRYPGPGDGRCCRPHAALSAKTCWKKSCSSRRARRSPRYFTLRRLDFGGCRLSLATPVDEAWNGPAALDGKRIATSYPHLLKRYLDQRYLL